MQRIEEAQRELADEIRQLITNPRSHFHSLIPHGCQPTVALHRARDGRKVRSDASLDRWSPPGGDEIRIRFTSTGEAAGPAPETHQPEVAAAHPTGSPPRVEGPSVDASPSGTAGRLADLVRALDRAETRPGLQFVALKWFRDIVLPTEGLAWTQSVSDRHEVLKEAIDRRLLLTSKVPNPKAPQFPVTAIRLNRMLPDVQVILAQAQPAADDFDPVAIRGENLSATVLRERR